jgi:pimeloyl-ACP methyl ester carboxylesterase
LEGFDYAYPVQRFDLESQRQALHMSYLDVRPQRPNGRTVVLLHGKNFCAGTWEATIRVLGEAGYHVVAPDQIGFCKSTKPERFQYSFQQLAANTQALLEHLGVKRTGRGPAGAEEEAWELSEPWPRGCPALSARNPRRVS